MERWGNLWCNPLHCVWWKCWAFFRARLVPSATDTAPLWSVQSLRQARSIHILFGWPHDRTEIFHRCHWSRWFASWLFQLQWAIHLPSLRSQQRCLVSSASPLLRLRCTQSLFLGQGFPVRWSAHSSRRRPHSPLDQSKRHSSKRGLSGSVQRLCHTRKLAWNCPKSTFRRWLYPREYEKGLPGRRMFSGTQYRPTRYPSLDDGSWQLRVQSRTAVRFCKTSALAGIIIKLHDPNLFFATSRFAWRATQTGFDCKHGVPRCGYWY